MQVRLATITAGILLLTACGGSSSGGVAGQTATPALSPTATASATPTPTPTPVPTATPTPTPAPTPTPTPTPTPSVAPPFACQSSAAGGSASAASGIADVRVGEQAGYDRFVVEFTGPVPAYRVTVQRGTTFTQSPKGTPVVLAGTNGVLIWISPVADWTAYSDATSFQPGYPVLREARLIENFEAVQQWALGVDGTPCLRVFTLDQPARLVVDVAS